MQVAGELRKMTAFIRQEALEKAKEIQIKADEEFAIEKSKLVREETSAIDKTYEKKFKQAAMSQQITRSTLANKTRLKLLGARQELLDELFERVRSSMTDVVTKDQGKHRGVLKNLMLEGVYALNEDKIHVRARKGDYDVLRKAIREAKSEYKDVAKRDVEIDIDEKDALAQSSAGGIRILNGSGKIDVNNTFEERLRLLQLDALPAVRNMLFGANEHRKFYD
ncbi:MAG: V-ATPase V1 sector subunit E [Lichina confinis]|nr:MAG: V-ATPase V1 sector subunit E [Lichina confinis]